jgi:hypothetical protein
VPSLITLRQSTYWEFLDAKGSSRIHFIGKKEFQVAEDEVPSIEFVNAHPLLIDYLERHSSIYVAEATPDPLAILAELQKVLLSATAGWRDANSYLNDPATRAVLAQGHGLVFSGPESLGSLVMTVLSNARIAHSVLPGRKESFAVQALIAGHNWVVAEKFRVEELSSTLRRTRE